MGTTRWKTHFPLWTLLECGANGGGDAVAPSLGLLLDTQSGEFGFARRVWARSRRIQSSTRPTRDTSRALALNDRLSSSKCRRRRRRLLHLFSIIIRAMSNHLCERYNVHSTISIAISTSTHCDICHCPPWHCARSLPIIRARRRPFTRFRWRTLAFVPSFEAKLLADWVCHYYTYNNYTFS